ncbi:hypothetical protein GCM10009839_54410 [Catenulispora yoronensis]|uniref:Thioesterase domain-containing protein n=1 Tax=Catenulispora yoronensis TaxID=450799 RepID=A0ABN2UUX5_9ACTN
MNRPDWHRIGAGAEGDLVLAVDVDGTARSEATFHDLAPLLARNHDVRLTTLPDDLPDGPGEPSLEWFVDGWAHAMGAWAPRVEAVFGYCSGSLFALALADRMEDGYGVRPRVVLFDPERPTAATFLDDFTATVQAMSALTADERDSHVRRARRATEGEPDLEQVTEILATAYGEACGANLERLGIAADIGVELELAFRGYGSYLLRASQIEDDGLRWGDTTVLLSAGATADGFDGRHLRIDAAREDLLRSEATAAQVRGLLKRVAA